MDLHTQQFVVHIPLKQGDMRGDLSGDISLMGDKAAKSRARIIEKFWFGHLFGALFSVRVKQVLDMLLSMAPLKSLRQFMLPDVMCWWSFASTIGLFQTQKELCVGRTCVFCFLSCKIVKFFTKLPKLDMFTIHST